MRATLGLRGVRQAVYETQNNISKSVTCPILFIHGRQDQILPVKHSQLAAAANNIARIEVIENCGHAPQLEHPQQVNTLLKQFMVAT
jgi:pimeloyl-ACP methyl ester carboxylesterase